MEAKKLDCGIAFGSSSSARLILRRCCGKLKPLDLFRIEDKTMLKMNNLALCALALLPIALTAQTPVPSTAQTQASNDHRADEVAIE
jgi:hypothetical protein